MEFLVLPDDVLLEVFGYLDSRGLLLVRRVCRQWRDVAQDPSLWRHRRLQDYTDAPKCLRGVLGVAPCLRLLDLKFESSVRDNERLLTSSGCAVESLLVFVTSDNAEGVVKTLRNQAALGRLRSLSLTLESCTTDALDGILSIDTIEDLFVRCVRACTFSRPIASPARAFLKRLQFVDSPADLHPLFLHLLSRHAPTLEVVRFVCSAGASPFHGLPLPAMPYIPHLRELECTFMDSLCRLSWCTDLRQVTLTVDSTTAQGCRHALDRAASFLCEPSSSSCQQKIDVKLSIVNVFSRRNDSLGLITAAGDYPGRCLSLKTLSLRSAGGLQPGAFLPKLAAALPALPCLSTLDLGGVATPDFLEAVRPDTAPSLRTLLLDAPRCCPHAWIHSAETRGLLERNPRLHVVCWTHPTCLPRCAAFQELQCHPRACRGRWVAGGRPLGLYSHPERACAFHIESCLWLKL